ncbi:MAG: alpha/beta-hydrolase family protein [Paracoccaceae bacterium]
MSSHAISDVPMDPVRVYAGYNTKETFEDRADIAVQELIRSGGFDRSVLIVATATGTGWLDPAAIEPVAYLHGGDLSIISMQYSYLPSWLTLMIDPNRSRRAAAALFNAVYAHWKTLAPNQRPRLYLFGLSLGALGSEASSDLLTLLADPIQGAFWVGPPFASTSWTKLTAARNPGSPQWSPEYGDGSVVRFMTQKEISLPTDIKWGPLRIVYLQHGSDPMTFFSPYLAFHSPDWLGASRAPDISPYFQWYPVVSFVNVGFDIPMATTVPPGYGHTFTPDKYIDGWIAVTDPDGIVRLNLLGHLFCSNLLIDWANLYSLFGIHQTSAIEIARDPHGNYNK